MIVELEVRRRMRPRRSLIIHRWIRHEWDMKWAPDEEIIREANTFVEMAWPIGDYELVTCEICNRDYIYPDNRRCPWCAAESWMYYE